MLLSPRRLTVEKTAPRKPSAQHAARRRMVVSMPDLQDFASPELLPRKASLRKAAALDLGSVSAGDAARRPPSGVHTPAPLSPKSGRGKPELVLGGGDEFVFFCFLVIYLKYFLNIHFSNYVHYRKLFLVYVFHRSHC